MIIVKKLLAVPRRYYNIKGVSKMEEKKKNRCVSRAISLMS